MVPDLNWPDFQIMRSNGQLTELLTQLESSGIFQCPDLISANDNNVCKQFITENLEQGSFRNSSVGRKGHVTTNSDIRSDKTLWLQDANSDIQIKTKKITKWIEELSHELKNFFRISLVEIESHFSIYAPGTFYQKHIDNRNQENPRVFTFIFYFNCDWQKEHGGELAIYNPENEAELLFTIPPKAGTFVIFKSDQFYHEVLTSRTNRYTLTGWLRRHA